MTRNGNWIQTFTGKKFWPLDLRPDEAAAMFLERFRSLTAIKEELT